MIDADTYWLLDFDVRIHFVFLAGTYFLLHNFFPKLKVSSRCIYIYISIMSTFLPAITPNHICPLLASSYVSDGNLFKKKIIIINL